jgi:hypothetical protein
MNYIAIKNYFENNVIVNSNSNCCKNYGWANNLKLKGNIFSIHDFKKQIDVFLGIKTDRVSILAKYYAVHAKSRPENRGGSRKLEKNEAKAQDVHNHIISFTCRASHYGRRGAPGRKYLPSDLSVRKMYRLFKEQNHQEVSYSLYYSIFKKQYNLGFGHPASDACATCVKFNGRGKAQ